MDNNNLITQDLVEENNRLLNTGNVTITVHTLNNTFTTSVLKLNAVNTPLVVALLNDPKLFIHLKLPLSDDKFLILTKDVISSSIFVIEFINDIIK